MAQVDFCFRYYDGDATRDMSHMNRLQRGAYHDLIISQRKFRRLKEQTIRMILGDDYDLVWPALEMVMSEDEGGYYIAWVENSEEKMRKTSASQQKNVGERWNGKDTEQPNKNTETIPTLYQSDSNSIPNAYQNDTKTIPINGMHSVIPLEIEIENKKEIEIEIEEKGVQGEKHPVSLRTTHQNGSDPLRAEMGKWAFESFQELKYHLDGPKADLLAEWLVHVKRRGTESNRSAIMELVEHFKKFTYLKLREDVKFSIRNNYAGLIESPTPKPTKSNSLTESRRHAALALIDGRPTNEVLAVMDESTKSKPL